MGTAWAPAGRSVTGLRRNGQAFDAIVRPYNHDAAVVFLGGAQARQIEEEGTGAAVAFALSAMAEIYGDELRGLLARSFATRWGKDPFSRGSWSMATLGNQADTSNANAYQHQEGQAANCGSSQPYTSSDPTASSPATRVFQIALLTSTLQPQKVLGGRDYNFRCSCRSRTYPAANS